jgi:hypothetical protein
MIWGGLKCWGRNNYGQLGIGGITQRSSPADVNLGSGVPMLASNMDALLDLCRT